MLNDPNTYRINDGGLGGIFYIGDRATVRFSIVEQKYLTVELGQLGEYLPFQEQQRWRSHNVLPIDDRWFQNSNIFRFHQNATCFKESYIRFRREWHKHFRWDVLVELPEGDKSYFNNLARLLENRTSELDRFAKAISKIIVEPIDGKRLINMIDHFEPCDENKQTKREITILREYLSNEDFDDFETYIRYLRKVQSLRSSGDAHLKGTKYKKTLKFFDPTGRKRPIQIADDIFTTLTEFLDSLRAHFCPDKSD